MSVLIWVQLFAKFIKSSADDKSLLAFRKELLFFQTELRIYTWYWWSGTLADSEDRDEMLHKVVRTYPGSEFVVDNT